MSKATILLIDDDESATRTLSRQLGRHNENLRLLSVSTAIEAEKLLSQSQPEVVILDLSLDPFVGPESGLELLSSIVEKDPTVRVLVLTGHNSTEWGVKALQRGAASFIEKPAEINHLLALISDGISYSTLRREYLHLNTTSQSLREQTGLLSNSAAMTEVIESVAYAAQTMQSVLLVGETGTGKGVVAHAIHRTSGRRGPFIRFQPGYGTHDLIASELFGHKKGAFTGATEDRVGLIERADGGTLFIDEIDALPHDTQVVLLNTLQEKVYRKVGSSSNSTSQFRLIAATNRRYDELVNEDYLRSDFFHRIAHCCIELPPLKTRLEDIPILAQHFLQDISNRENIPVQGLTPDAIHKLEQHSWPGNIRELQAVVEGGIYRARYLKKEFVEASDLQIRNKKSQGFSSALPFREQVTRFEVGLIKEALQKCNDNKSKAAELLQMDRSTMIRILKRNES